jgi:hypothetical protein
MCIYAPVKSLRFAFRFIFLDPILSKYACKSIIPLLFDYFNNNPGEFNCILLYLLQILV